MAMRQCEAKRGRACGKTREDNGNEGRARQGWATRKEIGAVRDGQRTVSTSIPRTAPALPRCRSDTSPPTLRRRCVMASPSLPASNWRRALFCERRS
eukprot:10590335-Alexandrium_andersonii.AAC.1